ncbi:MAG: HAD hydrolase family protein, partial [Candidatus Kryptoniota bacterium]
NQEVDRLNKDLWSHYPDSFQVRLKRVYEVTIHRTNGSVETKRILAKSVGLGWLGYHAYLAGEMLSGFVPKIIGLRGGIIFMEWIDGDPLSKGKISDDFLNKMALYLARRTRTLALNEDPRSKRSYLGWGWLEILSILRKVYNNLLGYLKYDYLLNHLKQSLHSKPTLVDGRMCPGEWILRRGAGSAGDPDTESRNRLFKVDFEHHNFGAPELDVVDPAYDLAISSFEFQLTGKEEDKLVSGYSVESGDTETLAERIFLYKLLYATAEAERSLYRIMGQNRKDTFLELNHRIQWSWDFRIFTMNKFSASLMEKPGIEIQRTGIFFMDIDGVFDVEVMGFPHTTMSGLKALSLLRLNGYSVVPNTGRSCLHVRNYCASYGFYGGIGEYGSAIVDMVHDKEISLVDESVMDEISRCRSILEGVDGVFVDSDYRYIVRAFRYTSQGTRGLGVDYAEKLLNEYHLKEIKVITRNADTYFVGKHRNKGKAIEDYKNHIGYSGNSTIAVGDSDEDVPMLENVTYAFAPRNCSGGIRALSKLGKCEIVPVPAQRGLLRVAMKLARTKKGRRLDNIQRGGKGVNLINNYDKDSFQSMMAQLLTIAEYPFYKRIMRLFS